MSHTIGELFEKFDNVSEEERVLLLQKHATDIGFLQAIQLACDSRIVFDLPEGCPPLKELDQQEGFSDTSLRSELKRFYIFLKDHPQSIGLSAVKKEFKFIQLLENVSPKDRKAALQIKDKAVPWITKSLLTSASLAAFASVIPFFVEPQNTIKSKKSKERKNKKLA